MKTVTTDENPYDIGRWMEVDDTCLPNPPSWSCWCLNYAGGVDSNDQLFAFEDCPNCLGYGFMPVPPGEIWK